LPARAKRLEIALVLPGVLFPPWQPAQGPTRPRGSWRRRERRLARQSADSRAPRANTVRGGLVAGICRACPCVCPGDILADRAPLPPEVAPLRRAPVPRRDALWEKGVWCNLCGELVKAAKMTNFNGGISFFGVN